MKMILLNLKLLLTLSSMLTIFLVSCTNPGAKPRIVFDKGIHKIKLESRAFVNGGEIPKRYTCYGENISPPLSWSDIPEGTKSFVIIMEDPEAFLINNIHWVLYNIPGNYTEIEEGVLPAQWLPNDAIHGDNTFDTNGYSGPCPQLRKHTFVITIYALDNKLPVEIGLSRSELLDKIKDDIIGYGFMKAKF